MREIYVFLQRYGIIPIFAEYERECTGNLCGPFAGLYGSGVAQCPCAVFGGVEAYCTPFVRLEKGVIRNKDKRDVSPDENMVPRLIPQVIASEPEELRQLTDFLAELGYRELNVNMGCPFPLIVRRGKGAGILSSLEKVAALLETMKAFPEIRFSVKMRLGGQEPDEWRAIVPLLNSSCVTQVTLHPRIGKQQYKGTVDREAFRAFYEACELPLVYNGDLQTVADIREVLEAFPRLKGVMLGRGLLANPSLALAFREGELSEGELKARVARMHRLMYLYYHREQSPGRVSAGSGRGVAVKGIKN